ncbi:MAG: hypothetical protein ACI9S8_002672 [Chlamydiales bacterium]
MNRKNLLRKIAYLEFASEQLTTELQYVDKLMRLIGFPEGLETLKVVAHEVILEEDEEESDS